MWCHAVWQMCTDVLWDDPVRCDATQYGRCIQMFREMTLCDVIPHSMADAYRCFVRWPCVMWCHTVWQMCTDVLWDDPVCCDITQYGRCVQMFCEMTLCDVMSCNMADVYRCFVRWPCAMWCHTVWQMCTDVLWEHAAGWNGLTVQDSSLLDCFTLHLQQHFHGNLTAIRLYHTHWDWDINSSRNTLSTHHTNTLSYPPH